MENTIELRVAAMAVSNAAWRNRVMSAFGADDFESPDVAYAVGIMADLKNGGLYNKANLTTRLKSALEAKRIAPTTARYLLGDKSFTTGEFDHDFGVLAARVSGKKITNTLSSALVAASEQKLTPQEVATRTIAALHKAVNATVPQSAFETVGEVADRIVASLRDGTSPATVLQIWRPASDSGPGSFVELCAGSGEFCANEVVIIAARPAMGKTAVAISISENLVFNDVPVLFVSAEMTTDRLVMRVLSSMTGIPVEVIKTSRLTDEQKAKLEQAAAILSAMDNFHMISVASPTMDELEARIEEKIEEVGTCMVVVDYFGLIKTESSDWRDKDNVAYRLQAMAKRHPIGLILLAQLSRDVETRGGTKRPQLSDLRETGALEQIGDRIVFLYRPEYYGIMEDENHNSTVGLTELIVAKCRDGSIMTARMRFIKNAMRFVDIPSGITMGAPVASGGWKKGSGKGAAASAPAPIVTTDEVPNEYLRKNPDDLPF